MKRTSLFPTLLLVCFSFVMLTGCDDEEADGGAVADPYNTVDVRAGDSCRGIGADEGLVACNPEATTVLACSSLYDYVWTELLDCAEGETCTIEGPDLASCG